MGTWTARVAGAFRAVRDAASRLSGTSKVKATLFDERNGKLPFNASGVVQVGRHRFIFVDNHDPTSLFELVLDDGTEAERIQRRVLAGVMDGELRDPEGLTRLDHDGEIFLIASSSLCAAGTVRSDGLVRARHTPHGDLETEAMQGFRAWLLDHEPWLAASADQEPDAGGLNIEGLAWDPHEGTLLFGLRGPADPGEITVIRIPVDAATAPWTTSSLGTPSTSRIQAPKSTATQGIRDISYDEQAGEFLMLLGQSTRKDEALFQLCTWDGTSDKVTLLDVEFKSTMKPEGVTTFWSGGKNGDKKKVLIVDDRGGFAVFDYPRKVQ